MDATIRKLRMKITLLVTVAVGLVLAAVVSAGYAKAYEVQSNLVRDSLRVRLHMAADERPQMGTHGDVPPDDPGRRHSSVLTVLLLNVSADGTVLSADAGDIEVDTEALSSVVGRVLCGETSGSDRSCALAWDSLGLDDGTLSIGIVDISAPMSAMSQQAAANVAVLAAAVLATVGLAWMLSGTITRPVSEAWESQRQFVADASHELKTPLAVIMANMSVISRRGRLDEEDSRWVEATTEEAGRMSSLIGDMLELARADDAAGRTSKGRSEMPETDLSDLVEEVAMDMDAMAYERGHQIEEDVAEGISVRGDAERLARALRVLIDNATKYGAEGSDVSVRLTSGRRHATISVHNDGEAMSADDMAHVFDRFYRSDKARTGGGSGGSFGLGLPIAKGIAEEHGGTLTVESEEGRGTTFFIRIPLAG